ncbi:uncharacterized protein LOC106647063 [Copidosoma floridanum]|uniref:uncharacterized protein LOC106647063 n=1 Tax=Copidosoma floridanum TaxID=29053 RepID=UPI0006C98EB4|nr:uncharacterized protein LOC106647063 [Copidosoma floridanum]
MAAVLYSRLQAADGSVHCHILFARTKLAPIRTLKPMAEPVARMTIPRSELRAALLAAKLPRLTAKELAVPIERCHAWCDSQILLHWVRSDQPTNNALVDNYVAQMQDTLSSSAWWYLPSQSNPWDGPPWLANNDRAWPHEALQEVTPLPLACYATCLAEPSILERYSKLHTLLVVLVRTRQWVRHQLRRPPVLPVLSQLTPTELQDAFLACIRLSQSETFGEERARLQNGERLPKGNPLTSLAAFLDTNGILRVGGRLGFSSLPYEERHPPILSGASSLVSLVLSWTHTRALHSGYRVTSAYAAKRAWILGGPRIIKAQLRRCVVCSRLQACSTTQMMAPLPASRVTPSRAFGPTGVDYAGPFSVLASKGRGIRTTKGCIAVFVCMRTKALHLEIVSDLSTAAFLGALARFTGRRAFWEAGDYLIANLVNARKGFCSNGAESIFKNLLDMKKMDPSKPFLRHLILVQTLEVLDGH